MMLQCDNLKKDCKKRWNYLGKNKVKATCPDCNKRVDIEKCRVK